MLASEAMGDYGGLWWGRWHPCLEVLRMYTSSDPTPPKSDCLPPTPRALQFHPGWS